MGSAAALVDKATSDLLIGPDWAMNMEICDIINNDPGQAKDVVKAIKKRLGHRNPKVQILALTVLETIVKNCGISVHQQVAEKDVLHEMVKIVKRKTDMHVRDKILVLIASWQEAFGGPRGRYPQYYMAFDELRRMGIEFPERTVEHDAPIFTPPQSHPIQPITGYGSPAHIPSRLEALMNNDMPGMSLTEIDTARGRSEVLLEMLNALNPRDKQGVKDELIVELVEQCRSTQQRVMHLVNNTSDEELLRQGLALNDDLQRVLEKHDAIASGRPLSKEPTPRNKKNEPEPEDDFAQLARRSSKQPQPQAASNEPFIQLALPAPPTPLKSVNNTAQKQDLIDLLSGGTLEDRSPSTPATPPLPTAPALQSISPISPHQIPPGNPFASDQPFQAVASTQLSYSPQQQQQQQQVGSNGTFSSSVQQQIGSNGTSFSPPGLQQQHSGVNGTSYAPVQQQQHSGVNGTSYTPVQQQQHSGVNGTSYHPAQQQQQQQQHIGSNGLNSSQSFSFPQYQSYGAAQTQNSYVAPWAMPTPGGQLSPQQQALIYGGAQQGSQPQQTPAAPWASPLQPNQQQMYGGSNYYGTSGYNQTSPYAQQQFPYSEQYAYQYGAGSYYQNGSLAHQGSSNQLALVPASSGPSPAKPSNPADRLFEDLVDMQGLSSKFKSAGLSSSLTRSSTSKTGST